MWVVSKLCANIPADTKIYTHTFHTRTHLFGVGLHVHGGEGRLVELGHGDVLGEPEALGPLPGQVHRLGRLVELRLLH